MNLGPTMATSSTGRPHRRLGRFTVVGLLVGLCFAILVLVRSIWVGAFSSGPGAEGAAVNSVMLAVIAGAPANVFLVLLVDLAVPVIQLVPGLNVLDVLLAGVILNWGAVGWIADAVRASRAERA